MSHYNRTDTCDECKVEKLRPGNARREYDGKEEWTGRWLCEKCGNKRRQKLPNSQNNSMKQLRNTRTGNQDPSSSQAKGDNSQELTCILYGWEDLNKKYDNYSFPIDCYDPKTGLYHQVRGRHYNSTYQLWSFGHLEREWKKKYGDMVCFCKSKDGKIIERIYKFPEKEIMVRTGINIVKNPTDTHGNSIIPWYEKYRIIDGDELKKANDIWNGIYDPLTNKTYDRTSARYS